MDQDTTQAVTPEIGAWGRRALSMVAMALAGAFARGQVGNLSFRRGLWLLVMAVAVGCGPAPERGADGDAAPRADVSSEPLSVWVIDDVQFAEVLERERLAQVGQRLSIRQLSGGDLAELTQLEADVVVFPTTMLGDLVARRWIAPIPDNALDRQEIRQALADVFRQVRVEEIRWGRSVVSLPLGSPRLILVYRQDLLGQLGIQPPRTWHQYRLAAERLAAVQPPPHIASWSAVAEPLGAGWAATMLLARAASYARSPSHYSTVFQLNTMEPLINGPPFVRALSELVDQAQAGFLPADADSLTPSDTLRRIVEGHCAMSITWAGAAREVTNWDAVPPSLGVCPLPRADEFFNPAENSWQNRERSDSLQVPLVGLSGRLGAVSRQARDPTQALFLLAWMTSGPTSQRVAAASFHTAPYRMSHLESLDSWLPEPLRPIAPQAGAILLEIHRSPTVFPLPRLPHAERYMAALEQAVRDALTGRRTPQQALDDAARAWNEITRQLDLNEQRDAYVRSLGLEP